MWDHESEVGEQNVVAKDRETGAKFADGILCVLLFLAWRTIAASKTGEGVEKLANDSYSLAIVRRTS